MAVFYRQDEYGIKNYNIAYKLFGVAVIMFSIIFLGASLLVLAESDDPGAIIHGYWDAVWLLLMASSTIGFGDFYPVTGIGRIIVGVVSFMGVGMFGYITSMITISITQKADTEILNRELKKQNAEIINNSKEIIRTNNLAVDSNNHILEQVKNTEKKLHNLVGQLSLVKKA
jgi:voltage-gated potassium channel